MENNSIIIKEQLDLLIQKPTTLKWEIEINNLLNGEREYALIRLHNAKNYINKIIAKSSVFKTKAKCKSTFIRALERIIMNWNPEEITDEYFLNILFELIYGFSPAISFSKIIKFINIELNAPIDKNIISNLYIKNKKNIDLHKRALLILGNYFTSFLDKKNALNLNIFKDILLRHIALHKYTGFAIGYLIQLNLISIDDALILEVIETDLYALEEILTFLLSNIDRSELPEHLGHIYSHCLDKIDSKIIRFEKVLQKKNIKLLETLEEIKIILPTNEEIILNIPIEHEEIILEYILEKITNIGYEKLSKLKAS